jgi:hypothetical protein
MKCAHCGETVRSTDPCPVCGKATAAPAQEPLAALLNDLMTVSEQIGAVSAMTLYGGPAKGLPDLHQKRLECYGRLSARLNAAQQQEAPSALADEIKRLAEDFAEWLACHAADFGLYTDEAATPEIAASRTRLHAAIDRLAAAQQPGGREPLSDERLADLWRNAISAPGMPYRGFARAIEAAHGIGIKETTDGR